MAQEQIHTWEDVRSKMTQPAFPDVETEFIKDKGSLFGKEIVFKDIVKRGEDGSDWWLVVLGDTDGKAITFSISGVVAEQLMQAKDMGLMPFKATMTKQKSSSGREYFSLA